MKSILKLQERPHIVSAIGAEHWRTSRLMAFALGLNNAQCQDAAQFRH